MQTITIGKAAMRYSNNPGELIQSMGITNAYIMNQAWTDSGNELLHAMENGYIETAIISGNPDVRLNELKESIRCFKAGGGLVVNQDGEVLMIFRNGVWDLPKGKWEDGESIEECALREVQEETGVQDIQLGEFIDITRHLYRDEQGWVLKETYWYKMKAPFQELVPQTEEGISVAMWVAPHTMDKHLLNTYYSIQHVIEKSGYV